MTDRIYDFNELFEIHTIIKNTDANNFPVINYFKIAELNKTGTIRLGVFPSSFNPLTNAHIELVNKSMQEFNLDEVLLLIDKVNVDKTEFTGALPEDRVLMLKMVFESRKNISIGISSHGLFLDKISAIHRNYGKNTDIYFITGYDTIQRILDKKYYTNRKASLDKLFKNCFMIAANRGDKTTEDIKKLFGKEENKTYERKIYYLELPPHIAQISSTAVRASVEKNCSFIELVPDTVERFINFTGLYKPPENQKSMYRTEPKIPYSVRERFLSILFSIYNTRLLERNRYDY